MDLRPATSPAARFYLPDFCAAGNVLAVVLIAELIALLLTLARYGIAENFWPDLARTSLFLLWVGLGSAAALCVARPRLQGLDARRGSIVALALMLAVTAAVTEAAWWLATTSGRLLGMGAADLGQGHAAFMLRNLFVGAIASGLALRYFYVSQQWKRNVEAEAAARVRALQARIRPHFLFNSMNAIASLTRSDPARAEEAVTDLADLFRVSLREVRDRIPLAEEIEIARTYERIERLRLGDRLRVDWQLGGLPEDAHVPALVLQPLLENAVYHGIEPLAAGGVIVVRGRRDGRFVELTVENPRDPGIPQREGGSGIGLDNVRQRLELMFDREATLGIADSGDRFAATLRFPAGKGDA
jgi:two-component system sensor histidine kinase AlgZ